MAKKWSNLNLPGALHFVTANVLDRTPVFARPSSCAAFLEELGNVNNSWPSKLIAYVLMPDHFHLVSNPRDGRIIEFIGALKSHIARRLGGELWQESFKAVPLWSDWMVWQKINYIHANPVRAGLVKSARDYQWSSFHAYYPSALTSLALNREWWWPDDAEKLSRAIWAFAGNSC
ncbi:MAG TPA: transposase [Pyrinomonadaceae bacterium]|nr:transposase [Pyrinomonadaceae bacterium]